MTDDTAAFASDDDEPGHPLLDWRQVEGRGQETWVSWLGVDKHWVLGEHRMQGEGVLPGTGYLELVRAAFELQTRRTVGDGRALEIRELVFFSPLVVAAGRDREVRTALEKRGDVTRFRVLSRASDGAAWQEHAAGAVAWVEGGAAPRHDLAQIAATCAEHTRPVAGDDLVPKNPLLAFGPRWRGIWTGIREVKFGRDRRLTRLALADEFASDLADYRLHPALLDVAVFYYARGDEPPGPPHLPFSYGKVTVRAPLPPRLYSFVRLRPGASAGISAFDITLLDESGVEVVAIEDYQQRRIDGARMAGQVAAARDEAGEGLRIRIGTPGMLESLRYHPVPRRTPGPGELEIEVRATGLNFKDVLFALGVLPVPAGEQPKLGMECAGVVTRVGPGVSGFAPGQEVFAMGICCFASHVTTPAVAVAPKPAHLSMAEAAALPNAYYTAWYSLIVQGRLSRGEKVLIHTAAGGVGLAAVKIAQSVGAEIFATAGNAEKRKYLSSIGVPHVMDSRSLAWADEVQKITAGKGVQVVLNSLAGEYIPKGLAVLARHGRFLELGVRDIYADTPLHMRPFEKGLSFFAVMVSEDLPRFGEVWVDLMRRIAARELPPLPTKVFPVAQVSEAFEFMARAKHIGKVAVEGTPKARA